MPLQVCCDSYLFCRVVKCEWLQQVEESGLSSTAGYEWLPWLTRFVDPTVPIPNRTVPLDLTLTLLLTLGLTITLT